MQLSIVGLNQGAIMEQQSKLFNRFLHLNCMFTNTSATSQPTVPSSSSKALIVSTSQPTVLLYPDMAFDNLSSQSYKVLNLNNQGAP